MYLIYTTEEDACERADEEGKAIGYTYWTCLLYTSPSPRD